MRMSELWQLKQSRPQLFRGLQLTIEAKAPKLTATTSKLGKYGGPDPQTTEYIQRTKQQWEHDPRSFWLPPAIGTTLSGLPPDAQIVGLYLQATQTDM